MSLLSICLLICVFQCNESIVPPGARIVPIPQYVPYEYNTGQNDFSGPVSIIRYGNNLGGGVGGGGLGFGGGGGGLFGLLLLLSILPTILAAVNNNNNNNNNNNMMMAAPAAVAAGGMMMMMMMMPMTPGGRGTGTGNNGPRGIGRGTIGK